MSRPAINIKPEAPIWEFAVPEHMPDRITLDLSSDESLPLLNGAALTRFEDDVLPAFLPQQRWFADKDAALGNIRVVDVVPLGGGTHVDLVIVEIEPSERMYFVPVAATGRATDEALSRATLAQGRRDSQDALLYDAFAGDALPIALVDDIGAGRRRAASRGGTFVAHAAPAFAPAHSDAPRAVRRLSVEQSNTSVVVDDAMMLKAYRRVHRGAQPELEVARFLDAVGYQNTPTLLGYVEYEHPQSAPVALCIVQRFVESQGDGWGVTLAHLERLLSERSQRDGARTPEDATFLARARTLGQRTAELHRAFATPTGDPAFEPEPMTDADISAWVEQAQATAQTALAALERGLERVPAHLREAAAALVARRDEIMDRLTIADRTTTVVKTRYHGDFHLGQVLVVEDDFMIVDFEGEPGREPAVRRNKSSPLRDVAGMLRSINYAAVTGLRSVTTERGEDQAALEAIAREWEQRSVTAFLNGYRATIAGCASYPDDPQQAQRLLDLFILEKAFYEISYELANRPAWLQIPLEGIRAILDAGTYAFNVN